MTTLYAIIVVLVATGMLIGYYLGWGAGRREGYDRGFADGKREGAVRAYAVGFDRGKHQREAKDPAHESTAKSPFGCALIVALLLSASALLIVMTRII